ncbi:hypothetical protein DOJK_01623 [Patescibacteria group bacterium]|nr:hypothetical protein DOJK_01623 [Patescibacteria group bacterium]
MHEVFIKYLKHKQTTALCAAGDDSYKSVEKKMNAVLDVEKRIPAWQTLESAVPIAHRLSY